MSELLSVFLNVILQSLASVAQFVTILTRICEGIGEMFTLNMVPNRMFTVMFERMTQIAEKISVARVGELSSDILVQVLRFRDWIGA